MIEMKGAVPRCGCCGSHNLVIDASAEFDLAMGQWVMISFQDGEDATPFCRDCLDETTITYVKPAKKKPAVKRAPPVRVSSVRGY